MKVEISEFLQNIEKYIEHPYDELYLHRVSGGTTPWKVQEVLHDRVLVQKGSISAYLPFYSVTASTAGKYVTSLRVDRANGKEKVLASYQLLEDSGTDLETWRFWDNGDS